MSIESAPFLQLVQVPSGVHNLYALFIYLGLCAWGMKIFYTFMRAVEIQIKLRQLAEFGPNDRRS